MHRSNIALVAVSLTLMATAAEAGPPGSAAQGGGQLAQLQWDSSGSKSEAEARRRDAERKRRKALERQRRAHQKTLDAQRRARREASRKPGGAGSNWRADDAISNDRRAAGAAMLAGTGAGASSGAGAGSGLGSGSGRRLVSRTAPTAEETARAQKRADRFRPAIEVMRHVFLIDIDKLSLAIGLNPEQRDWEERIAARVSEAAAALGGQPPTRWGRKAGRDDRFAVFQRRHGTLVADRDDRRMRWRTLSFETFSFRNGWSETVAAREDGTTVTTLRDNQDVAIRRVRRDPDGRAVTLFNNLPRWWGGEGDLSVTFGGAGIDDRLGSRVLDAALASAPAIFDALTARPGLTLSRSFTLNQILMNQELRDLMPRVDVDSIHFDTGSAEIDDSELEALETIGAAMAAAIEENPREVYLIEGHTDAQGDPMANLRLSARRAAAVATALTEAFEIPPENLVTQGYGEFDLKHETVGSDRRNRRVSVRRLTPLMTGDPQMAEIEGLGGIQ